MSAQNVPRELPIIVRTSADLGKAIRQVRKRIAKLRQVEAARLSRVSPPFLGKLENGGESVHLGKALEVCHSLGIQIELRLPTEDPEFLEALRAVLADNAEGES